jgi:hypothetical protein
MAILASPFKPKMRLEAENAMLRHQLIVLRRRRRGRVRLTNNDRWLLIHRENKDAPVSRPVQRTGVISSRAILGGLHHRYARV